jgi:NTE family protein
MRHPALLLAAFAALIQACVYAPVPSALAAETNLLDPPVEATTIASLGKPVNRDASILTPPTTTSVDSKLTFGDRQKSPRLVLAFSGGGCKTAAQIGVLRSLEKHHIPIDAIVATSMGATIGALYCAGMSVDDIEKLFVEKELQKSILSKVIVNAVISPIKPIVHIFTGKPYAGMSSGKGYYKFLEKNLPATFAELKTPFAAVVTNITDGQTCVLADGDLPRAVLASNAVPTLIRPVMIKGKLYVDGGLRANLPVNIAQSLTTGLIVSVLVDSAIKPEANKKFKSKNNLVMRVADIVMASSDRQQAKNTDILIYPDVDFVPGLTQDPVLLKKGILAGEKAADIMAPKIEAALIAEEQATRGIQTSQAMDAIKVVPEAAQTTEVK